MRKAYCGFTLVELLVVMAIVSLLAAMLLPVLARAKQMARITACASNLKQISLGLLIYVDSYSMLPVRSGGLEYTQPHLFHRTNLPSVAPVMESLAKSRDIYYCPANYQKRTARTWWPNPSNNDIAGTYQFPHWVASDCWLESKPSYRHLTGTLYVAGDYYMSRSGEKNPLWPAVYNHTLQPNQLVDGMNQLYGDSHVKWYSQTATWMNYIKIEDPTVGYQYYFYLR